MLSRLWALPPPRNRAGSIPGLENECIWHSRSRPSQWRGLCCAAADPIDDAAAAFSRCTSPYEHLVGADNPNDPTSQAKQRLTNLHRQGNWNTRRHEFRPCTVACGLNPRRRGRSDSGTMQHRVHRRDARVVAAKARRLWMPPRRTQFGMVERAWSILGACRVWAMTMGVDWRRGGLST